MKQQTWIARKHFSASVPEALGSCGVVRSSCLYMHMEPKGMKQSVSLDNDHALASSPASIMLVKCHPTEFRSNPCHRQSKNSHPSFSFLTLISLTEFSVD